jgi:class 3 adenylate cyclase
VAPVTQYARSGDVNVAFQVYGDGPIDLLFNVGLISHLDVLWEEPAVVRTIERLGSLARVILMDRRGTGLSDPIAGAVPIEEEIEDVGAVLDAAGSERAVLYGYTASGPYILRYAAVHPERVRAVILYAPMAVPLRDEEAPFAPTAEERARNQAFLEERWGQGANAEVMGPAARSDPRVRQWFARLERLGASPGGMRLLQANFERSDPRDVLDRIRVPTLLLHRKEDPLVDIGHSRLLARRIPGAKLVELEGDETLPFLGDNEAVLGEVEEFLTGGRRGVSPQRALLTVLFTDICDGTQHAARIGDGRWRDLLAAHDTAIRRAIERHRGREVKTVGDGFLAVFEGAPSDAVRAARDAVRETAELGVEVRAGLHTGECELMGGDVGGMAVHIAARVSALAGPREVLASGTTFGTVVGSGLTWDHEGERELKGVPGPWPIFRLAT